MTNAFEENNFKNYLRNNANEDWFRRPSGGVEYETVRGTRDFSYDNSPTVKIKNTLKDPGKQNKEVLLLEGLGGGTAAGCGAMASVAAAPETAGISIAFAVLGGAYGIITKSLDEKRKGPENIHFTLEGDNSIWVAYDVPVEGVKQVVENICRWSNEIWQERFTMQTRQEQPTQPNI